MDTIFEPMQLDASIDDIEMYENESPNANEANALASNTDYQVETAPFEVEIYASQYSGYGKLLRLMYVADHCPSLQIEALELASKYLKESTYNVQTYMKVCNKLTEALTAQGKSSRADFLIDHAWIEKTTNMSQVLLDKLETDLKNYKTNSIKESIRRGHDDLGTHYLLCGDLFNALKCFSRSRDYCIGDQHMFAICMNIIKLNIYLNNWNHVNSYVCKAEANELSPTHSPQCKTKLTCVFGLHDMVMKRYNQSASRFIKALVDDLGPDFADIISANNVAIYGGLCALATFDRKDLKKKVLSSASFKMFLELEPQLREAIQKFHESKYPDCLKLLDELKDAFMLDIYLAPHVKSLYEMIRNRALIQYFSPYLSADLTMMAEAFKTTVTGLENELMQLILDGQIQARIDSHNKILYARDTDPRLLTFEKALERGREWQSKATALILRAACARNGSIYVRPTKKDDISYQIPSPSSHCAPSSPNIARSSKN